MSRRQPEARHRGVAGGDARSNKDPLTTEVVLHRLHAGLGIAHGGRRGSLTRAATSVLRQQQQQGDGGEEEGRQHDEAASSGGEDVAMEFRLQRLELTKLLLAVRRNEEEIGRFERQQAASASAAQPPGADGQEGRRPSSGGTARLRSDLDRLRQVQSCLEEYEALAKLTVGRHAVSEHELQRSVAEAERRRSAAQSELRRLSAACRVRGAQVGCLRQCVADLQRSLGGPLELREGELEGEEGGDGDPMQVEEQEDEPGGGDEKEEEDMLYGDL